MKRKARKPTLDRNVKPDLPGAQAVKREATREERLIEQEEDRIDVEEAERRLADPTQVPIPYEQVRARLGLTALPD